MTLPLFLCRGELVVLVVMLLYNVERCVVLCCVVAFGAEFLCFYCVRVCVQFVLYCSSFLRFSCLILLFLPDIV